jgi:hypothetical protein
MPLFVPWPFRVRGVMAHAVDEDAARFYDAHGFVRSPLGERVMLMPIETVRGGGWGVR